MLIMIDFIDSLIDVGFKFLIILYKLKKLILRFMKFIFFLFKWI